MTAVAISPGSSALITWLSPSSATAGPAARSRCARRACRSWAVIAAAASPWPATSPSTIETRPPGSGTMSYQSPPTTSSELGRYRAASATPGTFGSSSSRSVRCRVPASRLSSAARLSAASVTACASDRAAATSWSRHGRDIPRTVSLQLSNDWRGLSRGPASVVTVFDPYGLPPQVTSRSVSGRNQARKSSRPAGHLDGEDAAGGVGEIGRFRHDARGGVGGGVVRGEQRAHQGHDPLGRWRRPQEVQLAVDPHGRPGGGQQIEHGRVAVGQRRGEGTRVEPDGTGEPGEALGGADEVALLRRRHLRVQEQGRRPAEEL